MRTFRDHKSLLDPVPGNVVRALSGIDRAAGEAQAKLEGQRDRLKTLIAVARIQGVDASHAIESIRVNHTQLKALIVETLGKGRHAKYRRPATDF